MISRLKAIVVIVSCSLFIVGIITLFDYNQHNKLSLRIVMQTSNPGKSQIFFDVGNDYNENDSYSISLADDDPKECVFPLPVTIIKSIRFDPINVSGTVTVKNARIENKLGYVIKRFPFEDYRPIQQISSTEVVTNGMRR